MTNVKATKLTNFKVKVDGGYMLINGWGLAREDGALYTANGITPHNPIGGHSAAKAVEATGLLPGARFLEVAA